MTIHDRNGAVHFRAGPPPTIWVLLASSVLMFVSAWLPWVITPSGGIRAWDPMAAALVACFAAAEALFVQRIAIGTGLAGFAAVAIDAYAMVVIPQRHLQRELGPGFYMSAITASVMFLACVALLRNRRVGWSGS